MPELPEVETLARGLRSELIGRVIKSIEINKPKMWEGHDFRHIIGKNILSISRIAKLLVITVSDDFAFLIHLKMTGQLIFIDTHGLKIAGGHPDDHMFTSVVAPDGRNHHFIANQPSKYTHITFSFDDGSTLYFNDMRQFGYCKLIRERELSAHSYIANVGIEPFASEFTSDYLYQQLQKRPKTTVKQVLLDQTAIAGIGNIYADESLFDAKLLPMRQASGITKDEAGRLRQSIITILNKAIDFGGTSYKDYVHHTGLKGTMQNHLMVYRRHMKPCKVCGTKISRTVIGGRGTHYCEHCQR